MDLLQKPVTIDLNEFNDKHYLKYHAYKAQNNLDNLFFNLFFSDLSIYFMCRYMSLHEFMYHVHAGPQRPEMGIGCPGTGVMPRAIEVYSR